jgi:bacteriorhodopsin
MIVAGMEEILKHTATLPTSTPTVGPIPTVLPPDWPVVQEIHDTGKRTLWVVVVLMAISALAFYSLAARAQVQKRLLHTLTALITTVSFLSYLAMATGEGVTYKHSVVHYPHKHVPDTHQEYLRQVFWVRYINWIITTPLILINIALLGGLSGANLLVAIAADLTMFVAGFTATYSYDGRRWVWYAIAVIAFLVVGFQVGVNGARSARRGGDQHRSLFTSFSGANLLVFLLYPIILAVSPLSGRISVDAETVAWAVHDILTQGLFGFWLLLGHDRSETGQLFVDGFWAHGINHEGAIRFGDTDGA